MRPHGLLLAGAILMAASSLDMTQNQSTRTVCPTSCKCSVQTIPSLNGHLKVVNCSHLTLKEFPENIPTDVEALLLGNNFFRNLSYIPYLPDLKLLDLSHNRIHYLDNRRIYANIDKLKHLYLKDNAITKLQHGSFSGLLNLDVLDLSENALQRIDIHAFGGLNHLQKLFLDRNQLREMNRLWLQAMPYLAEIHLSGNSIYYLEAKAFNSMPNLVHVDLSGNQLRKIDPTSFVNVDGIKFIDLSRNKLMKVPQNVLDIKELQILLLDENQFQRIETDDISSSNIRELSLSFLPLLRVIEKGAFTDLPSLVNLQLHDNPNLIFIHQGAFRNVSHLSSLFLHNNKLMSVPVNIKESLPSLTELHLYHNPLHCDCNVFWIKKELQDLQDLQESNDSVSDIYIKEADKLLCDSPTSRSNVPLKEVPMSKLSPVCPPTSIPFFPDSVNITIGEDLYLECQAIGVPQPKIHWLLPDNRVLNSTDPDGRVRLVDDTAITVFGVHISDSGTYACVAENVVSYDVSSTAVTVQQKNLKLYPTSIQNNYITVEWRGSIPRRQLSDFQLHYRESTSSDYEVLYLSASMPKCTIWGLKPLTTYEICIVYQRQYTVHCRNVTTRHEMSVQQGITRITTARIVAGVCTVVGVTVGLCCAVAVVRRFRKRKEYEEPTPADKDALSQIPLENLYQPPSTPLCTSRTALLPHSQI